MYMYLIAKVLSVYMKVWILTILLITIFLKSEKYLLISSWFKQ